VTTRQRHAAAFGAAAVLALEVLGSLMMWAPIPVAWVWVGAHAYRATDSFLAGACVWFLGFTATLWLVAAVLARLDRVWVRLRQRAGRREAQGVLTPVLVVTSTFALAAFFLWFYVIGKAFVIPFMPSGGG
jgi:hypothetical protein